MSDGAAIALAVVLLAANAFFVGAEFALISARRAVIEPRARAGERLARITLGAMERVSLMMAGAQLGITVCSLGLGYVGEPAIAHVIEGPLGAVGMPDAVLHPIAFAIALGIVVSLHVVLGEMVPKNLALAGPERTVLVLAPILVVIVRVLYPAIAAFNWIANGLLRLAGVQPKDEVTSAFTRDEVAGLVDESQREGLLDEHEGRLLSGALEFEERDVRSVLLPLERLTTVDPDITPHQLEQVAARAGFSRYPVCEDGELVGYLHLKDVLEFEDVHRNRPIARSWIRELPDVQATHSLRTALSITQRSGAHLARVRDETGQVLGVVALEDALEELVGEIRDEATATVGARAEPRVSAQATRLPSS